MIRRTVLLASCAIAAPSVLAQDLPVLIEVDASDLSAVVFSATGANPVLSDGTVTNLFGVTLIDVLDTGISLGTSNAVIASDLAAPEAGPYNRVGNDFGTLGDDDLNLWTSGTTVLQLFDTGSPAFTGSLTFDLTGSLFLPAGTTGELQLNDDVGGPVLGAWRIVPAPGTLALLPIGLLGLRRRR